jgi:hypothetical protein
VKELSPEDDPTARNLIEQVRVAISNGELERADELLERAKESQRAALKEAQRLLKAAQEQRRRYDRDHGGTR